MDRSSAPPLLAALPRPARGGSTRVQVGNHELVLEAVRGGFSFLWTNGRTATRHIFGLAPQGELMLQLKAPSLPVRILSREAVTVVPGARVAGYLQVSLVPTLLWRAADGGSQVLVELAPEDQVAEWDAESGHSLHTSSPWFVRFPMRSGDARAVVPVRILNRSSEVMQPPFFGVLLRDDELVAMRGSIVASPRRLVWRGVPVSTVARARVCTGAGA